MPKAKAILKSAKPVTAMTSHAASIKAKFARLKAIKAEKAKTKLLYQEEDLIYQEILPLFIEVHPDRFVILREFNIGSETFRLTPAFYDEIKGVIVSKAWKSVACPSMVID